MFDSSLRFRKAAWTTEDLSPLSVRLINLETHLDKGHSAGNYGRVMLSKHDVVHVSFGNIQLVR